MITETERAEHIAHNVIFNDFFISAAGYDVAAHTFTAAVGTQKRLTNIAGTAAARISTVGTVGVKSGISAILGVVHGFSVFRV